MITYSAETMRSFDRNTINGNFCSGYELMCRAGTAAAEKMFQFIRDAGTIRKIIFLAGKGNNGGDVFVMARLCENRFPFELFLTVSPEQLAGDAQTAWNALAADTKNKVHLQLLPDDLTKGALIVDGLLGTGLNGAPRGTAAEWIGLVNASKLPVLAVDIPSGLNADSGEAAGPVIHADLTVTMAGVKTGMVTGKGPLYTGRIQCVGIGIPEQFYREAPKGLPLFGEPDAVPLLNREPADSFKNRRGHLLVAGGSADYPSAPFLSAEAALRAGAGLVTASVPASAEIIGQVPRALIVRKVPNSGTAFSEDSLEVLKSQLEKVNAAAVGPGLSLSCSKDVLKLFFTAEIPCVFDADALNLLAQNPEFIRLRKKQTLLTPHSGEMKRLLAAFEIPEETPLHDAQALAHATGAVILLKGPHTIVAEPDGGWTYNMSGTPALATAGSGDVLTGICGALLASGFSAANAGRLGAFIHGLTGEIACPVGSGGIIADDLIRYIPAAFRSLVPVW